MLHLLPRKMYSSKVILSGIHWFINYLIHKNVCYDCSGLPNLTECLNYRPSSVTPHNVDYIKAKFGNNQSHNQDLLII